MTISQDFTFCEAKWSKPGVPKDSQCVSCNACFVKTPSNAIWDRKEIDLCLQYRKERVFVLKRRWSNLDCLWKRMFCWPRIGCSVNSTRNSISRSSDLLATLDFRAWVGWRKVKPCKKYMDPFWISLGILFLDPVLIFASAKNTDCQGLATVARNACMNAKGSSLGVPDPTPTFSTECHGVPT